MKFQIGQRVLVNYYDIENEPATIEAVDTKDQTYWCVFDQGRRTERPSGVGVSYQERLLDPKWMNEDELQAL